MILLIDNYDSFTYNLYQYLGELGEDVLVVRNDKITIDDIIEFNPEAIVLSPGPGRPENAGICLDIIKVFSQRIPILGICLGHQAIGHVFGASIDRAKEIKHGKISKLKHTGSSLFQYMPQPIDVMRYHSLVIVSDTLPGSFKVLARSMEDNEIMAIRHEKYPVFGLQFHPESIGTVLGKKIIGNFLKHIGREKKDEGNSTATI
ncbi:aminodeoxychorismate/anthranilate synthase component II [Cytobacillus sp.]|uniref:anthranilate synthase component II n=1 Tax=Cytobacillus sp. TaxID=2675269 RepID=UPI0028BD90B6|nr:aminodeoxychorismate/anthranilate synthase component II [Cytobacillus sp.]